MSPLEDCCTTCSSCSRTYCREDHDRCPDCPTQPTQRPASNSESRKRAASIDPAGEASYGWPPAVSTAMWAEVIREAQAKAWDEGARKQGQYVGPVAATQLNPYRRQA